MNNNSINIINLYRLPWNLADNSISWLEPTSNCNLYCDGCYRDNRNNSHKTLDEIEHELNIFQKYRKTDGVSIAGGEPLLHPQICDIVRLIRKKGWKPVINTNAITLELKYYYCPWKMGDLIIGYSQMTGWQNCYYQIQIRVTFCHAGRYKVPFL